MTYEDVMAYSAGFGLFFFIALFALVLVYALWPGNKRKFHDAARMPLKED